MLPHWGSLITVVQHYVAPASPLTGANARRYSGLPYYSLSSVNVNFRLRHTSYVQITVDSRSLCCIACVSLIRDLQSSWWLQFDFLAQFWYSFLPPPKSFDER